MKFYRFLLLFLLFGFSMINAEVLPKSSEILTSLTPELIEHLESNEHVFRYDEEAVGPVYVPETEYSSRVEELHSALSPEVMVEGLYRVPYPDDTDPLTILDKIFKLSHKISSISGARYYSERKKKYAVLFTKVYAVNNIEDKKRIEDPVPSAGSHSETAFLHMKENALGRGYYRMDYRKNAEQFTLTVTNESELGFIIPAVSEEGMKIFLQIIPCSDTILIYGYCGVVLQNNGLVALLLDPYYAFYRRMTAMETWLYNSLHGTDRLPPLAEPMP